MSKHKLHSLFAGNFLIHGGYAASFIPALYKVLTVDTDNTIEHDFESKMQASALTKLEAQGGSGDKTVIVISIKQPIVKYTNYWMELIGSKTFMRIMEAYADNPTVAGIVLDIDSGGGQVYGTAEFYDYIAAYPKPVVTYTDGYLCSAAYYIGNAARYIVANKRADAIGSIGALASWVDFTGLWEKLGATSHTMYATKSTKKNYETREVEENNNYEPYIKNVLDPIVETFHADMKATRPNLKEEVFTGDTWTGTEALEMGLVDELGSLDTAVMKVLELEAVQSNNQNNNNMSKTRTNLQAALGLATPLVEQADKGTYLNADQLDAVETDLENKGAEVARLTGELATANTATQTAQEALTAAQTAQAAANKATGNQVDALVAAAGITATGTTDEKLTALAGHYATIDLKDGAKPTNVPVGTDNGANGQVNEVGGIDITGALRS